ncbi:MAG: Clp protease ClpP [Vallitalea sp.]|nr:Clp protease ClpP [Vallitalea sp.]
MDKNKFWEFKNISKDEAELMLYGEIASERPWWDFENETVTHKQFIEDLKNLGDKNNITVRINSVGGDIFAAHAIYTNLKTNKAKITIIIDGLAASAATIVAMAGDVIKMPSNAMMMVHNPMFGMCGYFNSDELDKMSQDLKQIKESIISAYVTKTSLNRDELSELMNEEKWLTANESKNYGFADEIMFEELDTAIDGNFVVVNSISHDMSKFKTRPSFNKASLNKRIANLQFPDKSNNTKEVEDVMEIKNVADLEKAYPNLINEVKNTAKEEGKKEERDRIKDIEQISVNMDKQLVNKAKFDEPIDAKELAFKSLQLSNKKSEDYLNDLKKDSIDSKVDDVEGSPIDKKSSQEIVDQVADDIVASINERRK